jgi:hypothetical protein
MGCQPPSAEELAQCFPVNHAAAKAQDKSEPPAVFLESPALALKVADEPQFVEERPTAVEGRKTRRKRAEESIVSTSENSTNTVI